jgi:DNA-binding NtrC family response regulator
MTAGMIKILFVEDDLIDRIALERLLRSHEHRYECRLASSIEAARKMLKTEQFDVAIVADCLDERTAFEMTAMHPNLPVIITSGNSDAELTVRAEQAGAFAYLFKDLSGTYLEVLQSTIEQAIQQKQDTFE